MLQTNEITRVERLLKSRYKLFQPELSIQNNKNNYTLRREAYEAINLTGLLHQIKARPRT